MEGKGTFSLLSVFTAVWKVIPGWLSRLFKKRSPTKPVNTPQGVNIKAGNNAHITVIVINSPNAGELPGKDT